MEAVKILWSGITGRTGMEAIRAAHERDDVKIVAGLSQRGRHEHPEAEDELRDLAAWAGYSGNNWVENFSVLIKALGINVIVDFSHPEMFDQIVELAVNTWTPLVIGTSGLNSRQMSILNDAARQIPVFVGGNFRFKVKEFIDEVVEFAKTEDKVDLYESFYEGKSLPSETSRVIQNVVKEATGKDVEVLSSTPYEKESLICDWYVRSVRNPVKQVRCYVTGFDELARDVLEIAKVMSKKTVAESGDFYELDELWPELPH